MPLPAVISRILGRARDALGGAPAPAAMGRMEAEARRLGDSDAGSDDGAGGRRWDGSANLRMLIGHQEQFASKWGAGINVYWSRFDEALRDNWTNALAMRRSSFIEEMLSARKLPVAGLEWHVEVDDPKDPDQKKAQERLTKGVDAIPQFAALRCYLGEDKWQGKYASQLRWGHVPVDGRPFVTVTAHEPVDGDSIVYAYDKTPGILVRTAANWHESLPAQDRQYVRTPDPEWIQMTDRARALFLYDQFWRDHFIISNFNPRSSDYLFGGDQAASIFGVGYRGMLYWDFQLREELRSWLIEALQRIGVNGMLYGFFESGNVEMMKQVVLSLKHIIRDNVTAFPYMKGSVPEEIRHIEPSQVGYDVLALWIDNLEQSMRRAVLGQSLSSQAESTGMGSEVADLHRSTLEHILRSDAAAQQETLTRDLLGPMIRFNSWEYRGQILDGTLPFRPRFVYSIDRANVKERGDVIQIAFNMGLPLSKEQVYADLSVSPPKDAADALTKPEPAAPGAPGSPGGGIPGLPHPKAPPTLGVRMGDDGKLTVHRKAGAGATNGVGNGPAGGNGAPKPPPQPARRSA